MHDDSTGNVDHKHRVSVCLEQRLQHPTSLALHRSAALHKCPVSLPLDQARAKPNRGGQFASGRLWCRSAIPLCQQSTLLHEPSTLQIGKQRHREFAGHVRDVEQVFDRREAVDEREQEARAMIEIERANDR